MWIGALVSGLDGDWVEGAGGNRIVPTFAIVKLASFWWRCSNGSSAGIMCSLPRYRPERPCGI